jgi:hypothetical protein
MTKRGNMITPRPTWSGRDVTGPSTGPAQASTRGSWIIFVYSTSKESIRLWTTTRYKASPMRILNQSKSLSKRRRQRRRATSQKPAWRSTTSLVVPTPMSPRESRNSRTRRSSQRLYDPRVLKLVRGAHYH